MKALVYADLQATDGHEKCFRDPTRSLQIARVTAFYEELLRIYKAHKCTCLWDLGDTTDDRSSIPVPAIDAVCSALAKFPASEWNLKLIGNHEQFVRNGAVNVGQMFAPYFGVVNDNDAFLPGNNVRLMCCSYPSDEAATVKWIAEHKHAAQAASQKTILLGHFSVMGCLTGDGRLLAGIPKEALSWVNLGLLGHIHKPQSLSKNVHYVGSPFQQNWGETGEAKRVAIVDVYNATVEWVAIGGFPEYQTMGLDSFNNLCTEQNENRFKVILKSQQEAAKFYAHPLAHRAEPIYEFVEESGDAPAANGSATPAKWSFDSVVERYVQRFTPDAKGIPASVDEMVDYGKAIALGT